MNFLAIVTTCCAFLPIPRTHPHYALFLHLKQESGWWIDTLMVPSYSSSFHLLCLAIPYFLIGVTSWRNKGNTTEGKWYCWGCEFTTKQEGSRGENSDESEARGQGVTVSQ